MKFDLKFNEWWRIKFDSPTLLVAKDLSQDFDGIVLNDGNNSQESKVQLVFS